MKRKKLISLLLCTALVTSAVAPATSIVSAADPGEVAAVQTNAGPVSEIVGNVRVQVLSPSLIRLEQKGPQGFEDRETFHIENRSDWQGDTLVRSEEGSKVVLTTSKYQIILSKNARTLSGIVVKNLKGERVWRYTSLPSNQLALPERSEHVDAWAIADTPRMVPSEWGFSPQPEDNTDHADTNGWDLDNDAPDVYVFLPEGDNDLLREEFISLTGRSGMLPLSAFGAWDSRWYPYTETTALKQIDDYHNTYNYPLDNLVVDTDWRAGGATVGAGYAIATDKFPDMERFLQEAHNRNVQVMFNDHPEPSKDENGQNRVVVDPVEVEYRYSNLTNLMNMGLDCWWYDRNWSVALVPPTGICKEVMGMAVFTKATEDAYPDRRPYIMSNVDGINNGTYAYPSNIAAHRYGIHWTGDTPAGTDSLHREIENTVKAAANSLLPYVSTDLGGFNGATNNISPELYVRWTQFCTLSPIYRMHCADGYTGRMPWLRGEEALNISRDYTNMRYRMLPIYYQLSHENYETGLPLTRRLDFTQPDYESASRDDQYTLGDDILVAPVWEDIASGSYVPNEWLTTPDGQAGVKADYYKNIDQNVDFSSLTPTLTRTESEINFDWGNGSPSSSVIGDNKFGAVYTGKITIGGEYDVKLVTYVDDGVRVYIDGEKVIENWKPQSAVATESNTVLEKGKTYDLRVEYFEDASSAICQLKYKPVDATGSLQEVSRDVWIPEGEWINTFTGETVYGPQTIEVEVATEEMPLFVKKGAILPLADEMLTTKEKDWSHLTLDVYPSTRQADSTELYEDDTISSKYTEGQYRTTDLSTYFDAEAGKTVVKIGAANGSFDGERCFANRNWTVRVHQPENWGELQSAELADGTVLSFTKIEKDANAMPFAGEGGSPDSAVYEIELSGAVAEEKVINLTFASAVDPEIPDIEFDQKIEKGEEVLEPAIARTVKVSEDMPVRVNLTEEGSIDWVHSGATEAGALNNKANVASLISVKTNGSPSRLTDYATKFSWTDGAPLQTYNDGQNGSYVWSGSFEIEAKSGTDKRTLTLYIGGWQSTGRLEIYDDQDDYVIDSYDFGNLDASYYRKVTIDMQSEAESTLKIRWAQTGGTGNVTFEAAALKPYQFVEDPVKPEPQPIEVTESMPGSYDLTKTGDIDWIHAGSENPDSRDRKNGVEPQLNLDVVAPSVRRMNDYKTAMNFSDGTPTASASGNRGGLYLEGTGERYFELTAEAEQKERELTFFIGGWRSTGRLEIFDGKSDAPIYSDTFTDLSGSYYRQVTVRYSSEDNTPLRIKYSFESGTGNVVFVAASLRYTDEEEPILKGDVTGDGMINIRDLVQTKLAIMGRVELTRSQREIADMNDDGRLNVLDLLLMKLEIIKDF